MKPEEIIAKFRVFKSGTAGIGRWITEETDPRVLARLARLDQEPLSKAQLNQLLVLAHEAPVSFGFFRYYWLSCPEHFYAITQLPEFDQKALDRSDIATSICSLSHFYWGLYRLFVDGLLLFGNVRSAFRALRNRTYEDIEEFFRSQRFDLKRMVSRGPAMPLERIAKDRRYLISEMACKSLGPIAGGMGELGNALAEAFTTHQKNSKAPVTFRDLLNGDFLREKYASTHQQLLFSADDVLDKQVSSMDELLLRYKDLYQEFDQSRQAAVNNTKMYLSLVNELDIYVATSMRTRSDFRAMADNCERVFLDPKLANLNLRYFDPTLSAADGHEDKGLIECLMVKCCKCLVYFAGVKDSYGKDAEAAMALSLGKPVIFYCDDQDRARFYRDVHPLARLINFQNGVVVGGIVTHDSSVVVELLHRLFHNQMQYVLEQHPHRPGYIRLKERLTSSIVRLHTDDRLLSETFWNHYNERRGKGEIEAKF